ncbi:uncharacterized protein LOC135163457, partial [Diachasmimorpha longicaudata]|uniref:uncharacterized protein LOC135163457 n=1 Tax=Diachasmimorpha longicaudata TaxID=58733 RepID=UPI0030B8A06B
ISPSNSSPPEFPPPRPQPLYPWQRSSSCRELYATSFEDSGRARKIDEKPEGGLDTIQLPSQGELDNPITRYDDTNRSYSAASSKLPSLDHDSVPERVYSSSYPGTSSLSTESGHEESGPGADLSHDDLSHDSYELLEREHEFEYPESYSSPRDEAVSDNSDEGIEQEMFQMDSETDSFVKHRSIKSTDKQLFKSVLADIKNAKVKTSADRCSAASKAEANNLVVTETRIQRTSTQIERKYEARQINLIDQSSKPPLPHQDSGRKDPVVLQVQKQKMTVMNELKNLKPKYKITHVDSEVLRDEGIMRPKSRIDDDLSPVEANRTFLDKARERTTRARSIASLDDHGAHRSYVETGSLGRSHHRDKKIDKIAMKERKSFEREERKRIERENFREIRRLEKNDSRERRSMGRMDSRERRSMERLDFREAQMRIERNDSRELRRSIERLDSRERSHDRLDGGKNGRRGDYREPKVASSERLDYREMRKSLETLDTSPKEKSKRSPKSYEYDRHTLERFDSGNRSPFDRHSPRDVRGKSYERLDSRDRPTFDFDPRTIERLGLLDRNVMERYDSTEKSHDRRSGERRGSDRKGYLKQESRDRKSLDRMDSRERRSSDGLSQSFAETKKKNKTDDESPRERDDWRSLGRARKEEERRDRERQMKVFMESRTETIIGVPNEWESVKPKAGFAEYDPKVVGGVILGFDDVALTGHIPVERTKSDPNPGRQRIGSNSKRHILMHQKSIDLTPADSGDEDAFVDGATKKTNADIPYTLHKRHVMNGTASDDRSESDSGKNSKMVRGIELPKLPIKQVTDVSLLDLTKLPPTPTSIAVSKLSADRPKSILVSPDKSKSPKMLSPKLSPTEPKIIHIPSEKSPPPGILKSPLKTPTKSPSLDKIKGESRSSIDKKYNKLSPTESNVTIISVIEKRSPKKSPGDSNVTIVSVIEKRRSSEVSPNHSGSERSPSKMSLNFADIVVEEMKQEQRRQSQQSIEKQQLKVPDDSLEKQDSIEKIPLPEIPMKTSTKPPLPVKPSLPSKDNFESEDKSEQKIESKGEAKSSSPEQATSPQKKSEKSKTLEKPSIPEKTKRILDRIESRFSEFNKNASTKVPRPKIIDTGHDDFVDPVADLPLDEVPVKPAFELDSLKVPDFNPFMLRPHAEPLRSKSLSLAEEKAPIDTLLSPEFENKHFIQDVSPKKIKKAKSEAKKDFKKQSKSLEGDKPPLKKSLSKAAKLSPASLKIDKSKLKLGEMPQEIIIIDSIDVEPQISIVQKGRSKSITRLSNRTFSTSKDEETKKTRAKSASVDEEIIKSLGGLKPDKQRPKSLGISKSLGSTERETAEKISPKKITKGKSMDGKISPHRRSPSRSPATRSPVEPKEPAFIEESMEEVMAKEIEESQAQKSDTPFSDDKPKEQKIETQIDSKVEKVNDKHQSKVESKDKVESTAEEKFDKFQKVVSPTSTRKPGDSPMLFARLGLSEGSGIGVLERQGAATQSPISQRRAKSLDAPVVALHKLPPANAFSSKDDTVEEIQDVIPEVILKKEETKPPPADASPNNRSDSTDPVPTDSLSMTEPSTQYLESPSDEIQGITACPDLIPYEQEGQKTMKRLLKDEYEAPKIEGPTKFIDQSSVESTAEPDLIPELSGSKSRSADGLKKSEVRKGETSSGTDSSEGDKKNSSRKMKTIGSSCSITTDEATPRGSIERDEVPNVTVSTAGGKTGMAVDYYDGEDPPDMIKSPIQISIEECSDADGPLSDDQNDILDEAIFQAKQTEKPRLDSGDTSEDTLDALDAQMQMQGPDSDVSSPDYADKMDEKTLVEVELTPEYLEMRKDDMLGAEELPEDEPPKDKDSEDPNRLSLDKKSRLSTERSRSEETNTYTPEREDPDSSSCSIARPLGIGQIQSIFDRREIAGMRESRKEGSVEEESSSCSHPPVKMELSSTWKPFPLESSGSSSLEDAGWIPQDDNHHQSHSEDSNGPNDDSYREDLADYAGALPYPINPEVMANYGAFALSRTLSRISERSTTSEQDKSDLEDSFKPSSRSPSLDDESLISSDHQPSLSSDPPSGAALPSVSDDRRTSSELPDIPIDVPGQEDKSPKTRRSRLHPQTSEDWPSPPSSPLFDPTVCSHVETFYMEIKPEEAVKVTVTDSSETPRAADSDSSDENRTLHDDLHSTLLEDGQSSTSATTVDGTVKIAVKPKSNSYITGSSHSEDTSMGLSMSEWSSSNNTVRQFCQYSGTKSDDNSLAELGASISDWSGSTTVIPQQYYTAIATEKSQSDTTTSDKSVTSMRPNSKCQHTSPSSSRQDLHEAEGACGYDENSPTEYPPEITDHPDEFDEARKFVENQFDKHRRRFDDEQPTAGAYTDISPPQIKFQSDYDEEIDEDIEFGALPSIPGSIPEEDEEERLYDNVPAMKYSSGDNVRMKVSPGDSSEDMHERFADLASRSRSGDDEWSFEEPRQSLEDNRQIKGTHKFDRGYSEPADQRPGTRSTQRPVIVPVRAKSTPYYSTTSLSGESTTSSPPMPIRAQIRTKTIPYTCRSPQSEGDTSSSMDSPAHTPDRVQRAFRRKRQQNAKRRHRVAIDLEIKDGQIVSSTDSSFDVATIPPPLLPEMSIDIEDDADVPPHLPPRRRNIEDDTH